ncbi:unnamed protein product [Rotaria socialis]|uniref:C2H2-type domain-containing protein n=1 Tax=Rotaria socialis TaxID=392032 RepID=A0A821FTX6_9BILA|nr:unnamed protein product [Rotaria socialis]CAF3353207.1 unnamed protein product [Rotaria socialis]CAF3400549.1 unnamed protein product [Rotaria socialis]CAF3628384.1 unnamed protein product [Rotaria socialis]CAF4355743.1 unnamed protein product [Rotaria socialis]
MTEDNIQLPDYLCFKPSKVKIGQNGLFATRTLKPNEPLGVYRGKIRRILPQTADEEYVWAILSSRGVTVFYIDASNPNDGNFLRFIRWTHDKSQQNIVCMQQNQQIHYFSLRTIHPDEELLTFIEQQKSKKKDKRENGRTRRETRQQQSTEHQDNPAIKIFEQDPGNEFIDDDNVHLVMNNRSLEFELQITKKFLSETFISDGVKQTCLKCDICHQIFMSNVAFKFHYHTYHITPQYLSPANRPRTKVRDSCNICRYSFIANDVKSVVVDLLEVVAGGERLQENRYLRLHIYRCHWCAPIDAHYNTAKQLSQHVRSKHYRLLQALLATQANRLQNNSNQTRGKRSRDNEQDENNFNSNLSSSTLHQERNHRSTNFLQTNNNHDSSHRLPIPIGLPDPLTDRDCQQLFTIGEQVAYNVSNCIDGTLEDIQQNETFCRQHMDDDSETTKLTSIEHFLTQYPLVRELLGPRRRHDTVIQHLSDDYFDHPKNQNIDMSKYYQRQKSIPERRFIMNRYLCLLCTERFSSPIELIEHEKKIHQKKVSQYDWGWNSIGFLQSNPYAFILELENELKQQQERTKHESQSFLMNNNNSLRNKVGARRRSTSSNDRSPIIKQEDIKPPPPPPPPRTSSKRIKRELQRSNTCPVLDNNSPEKDEPQSGQRKSKRLRKSNMISPPPSPKPIPEKVTIKKEQMSSLKSSTTKDTTNPNQIIVKTDKRYYWCTKCSKVYLNLISLYTESHYRQCVGEDQHFNVIHDPSFFNDEKILQQLPSNMNNHKTSSDSNETLNDTNKKESLFFSKTTDDSRTYFINGKPIRMSTINRPITVKDLRQQFQQQTSFTTNNPSEEYIYHQRQSPSKATKSRASRSNENKNWSNESTVKVIPTPRSFDTFGISSDEEDEEKDSSKSNMKQEKPEIEKTLVKRRYDSEYTSIEQDDLDTQKQFTSKKSQPTSTGRSVNATTSQSRSSVRNSWKQTDDVDQSMECAKTSSTSTNRTHIPDALQDYDHVCEKCNMPFSSQTSLDEHQNGQCLEMNVLASCGSWFRCPLCSLTYCDANLMSLHINKTHRDVLKNNQRAHSQRRSNTNRNNLTMSTSRSENHRRKFS